MKQEDSFPERREAPTNIPISSFFDDEDDLKNIALSSMQLRNQIQLSLQEKNLVENLYEDHPLSQQQQQQQQKQQQQLIHYQIDPSHRKPVIKRINLLTGEGILEELEHEIQQTISSALDVCTRTLKNSTPPKASLSSKSSQGKTNLKKIKSKKSLADKRSPRSGDPTAQQQDPNIRRLTDKHSHYLNKILAQQKRSMELISNTKSTSMNLGGSNSQLLGHLNPQHQQDTSDPSSTHGVGQSVSLVPLQYPPQHFSNSPERNQQHPKSKSCLHCDHLSPSESHQQSPYRYLEQFEAPQQPENQVPVITSPEPNWHSRQADAEKVKTQLSAEPLPKVPLGIDEKKLQKIAKERNIRLNTYDPTSGLFGVDKLQERFFSPH